MTADDKDNEGNQAPPTMVVMPRVVMNVPGDRTVGLAMFDKGKQFIYAAVLLDRGKEDLHPVVMHLLCQGLEIVQKALLLARNYSKFAPELQKSLGHDLIRGSDALCAAYSFKPPRAEFVTELTALNKYYVKHQLRYGTIHDVFGRLTHLRVDAVLRRSIVLVRFGNRVFTALKNTPVK